jgi:integrase
VASLWKHPASDFWVGCFSAHPPSGLSERWKRSLKTTDRKLARRIVDALEDVGRGVMPEKDITDFIRRISDARTRNSVEKVFDDVFETVEGRKRGAGSLKSFSSTWVKSVKGEIAPQSYLRYKRAIDGFIEFLGTKADRDLISFTPRDDPLLSEFRDKLAAHMSSASANTILRIVKQMFKVAARRYRIDPPGQLLGSLKNKGGDVGKRRAFTLPEIGRILRETEGSEWQGMILAGLYTGQRLGDIATLRWENVDLVRGELAFTARKTGRRVMLPIAASLLEYLLSQKSADTGSAFVFPNAAKHVENSNAEHVGRLSNQFYQILVRAGLARRRTYDNKGAGQRKKRRQVNEISFHSFRHAATSLLKNSGVPQSVVMDIVGHESRAVSQLYTHVGDDEKRRAVARLPSLTELKQATSA